MGSFGTSVSMESPTTTIEGAAEAENMDQLLSLFRGCVLEGRWDYVLPAYKNNSDYHKIKINESRGTTLHVAVNDGMMEVINILVDIIIEHEGGEVLRDDSALTSTDERGDTPLHLAASRGFIHICKCIIGKHGERKDLIKAMNNKGETPVFRAVLTGQTKTFVYLHHVSKDVDVPLSDINGDTILHRAIWDEFLGIPVEPLDAAKAIKSYWEEFDKFHEDDEHKVNIDINRHPESEGSRAQIFVEQKYATSVRFLRSVGRLAFKGFSLSRLGVYAHDLKAIKKMRQKHKWGNQLLSIFMKNPYESYIGISGGQPFPKFEEATPFITQQQLQMLGAASSKQNQHEHNRMESAAKSGEKENTFVAVARAGIDELVNELHRKVPSSLPDKDNLLVVAMKNVKYKLAEHHVDRKETAFLAAAKNGIVDIVLQLLSKIPTAAHETNSNNENVLLVAVKNRQTNVVEVLRKRLDKGLFDSLILEVDNRDNTVLHLAAGFPSDNTSDNERTWQIAGAAMQIVVDIKWFQYIRGLVPDHFNLKINKDSETPWEIFEKKRKDRVEKSSHWLKETSNSCSTVAALIAGVSFAASTTLPGGTEKGKPLLEGEPAFDAFAIASLIALCFSVTALIMFLAIYTSEKQLKDFHKSLPLKLLFGLSSLFLSITSMFVSFSIAHFFVLKDRFRNKLFPLYVATCFPVVLYGIVQFPLYYNVFKAIFKKLPQPSNTSIHI